jgi:hypothetical protein
MLYCQFCNRELKNQGSKNLHERACIKNPKNQDKKNNEGLKCLHNLVTLNKHNKIHQKAILDGYTVYCSKCKELL